MLLKCCPQYVRKFEKFTSGATGLEKVSFFIQIPKKGNAKKCLNYCTIVLISHASKTVLKVLQARLQQYMNREPLDVQTGFRKGKSNCQHSMDHGESKGIPENHRLLLH